jgi:hypothetical protein
MIGVTKQLLVAVTSFLLGIATVFGWHAMTQPTTTEVWVAKSDLVLQQGSKIAAGTEFVVEQYMAEGFVALKLTVNVEALQFNAFKVKHEPYSNLRIPVWLQMEATE